MNTTNEAAMVIGQASGMSLSVSQETASALARAGLLRQDGDNAFYERTIEVPEIGTPILQVWADAGDLLDHYDDDEAKTFEFLAKLKDLLTP